MMSEMPDAYKFQDRGTENSYNSYLSSMDAVSIEKVASASVFFDPKPGNTIVDIGMASGTSSSILARLFPKLSIIGVDINPKMVDIARQTYQMPNLEFRIDDGEKLSTFDEKSISGFFNCSSIHHITSFNCYETFRAYSTLKRQTELLKVGGVLTVRDFVKPPEMEVILELSCMSENGNPDNAELLLIFSKTSRSLANPNEQGFPLKELKTMHKNTRRFLLFYADALEFIRRKDYFMNWDVELQEEYGYFTQKEFEDTFASLGLRVILSCPVYNPWIIRNRYKDKFVLYDRNLNDLGLPPTNYLIAGEKIADRGTSITIVRHLPENKESFLKYESYLDIKTNKISDVVLRPNSVLDIIPYFNNCGNIEVIAKHGYPRPIVNIQSDSPVIDQKKYSGYITEGLTAANHQSIELVLAERTNLKASDVANINKSLEYYTSPGGINEKVESSVVELVKSPEMDLTCLKSYSGFANSGSVRKYDALQLLKTAQTGALVEARLELNIYNLLRKLNIELPLWLGEKIEVRRLAISHITSLSDVLSIQEKRFKPTAEKADYLQKHRVKFAEVGVHDSSNILEFVTPSKVSSNTLATLPVAECNNQIYVGLEIRSLPVPELQSGNSIIPVVPACRLPKDIKNYKDLDNFICDLKIMGAAVNHFTKLGEKFFPSVGITPEQVYPYVVSLEEPTSELKWVSLKELYDNLEKIKDGHLLISIVRLVHALL